jgi:hypothetical protein
MLLASYTYCHALGDSINRPQFEEMALIQPEGFSTARTSARNELPFGTGRPLASNVNRVEDGFTGASSLQGIFSYESGGFVSPSNIVKVSNSGTAAPDEIGNPNSISHHGRIAEVNEWFHTAAFQRAPAYTFWDL